MAKRSSKDGSAKKNNSVQKLSKLKLQQLQGRIKKTPLKLSKLSFTKPTKIGRFNIKKVENLSPIFEENRNALILTKQYSDKNYESETEDVDLRTKIAKFQHKTRSNESKVKTPLKTFYINTVEDTSPPRISLSKKKKKSPKRIVKYNIKTPLRTFEIEDIYE